MARFHGGVTAICELIARTRRAVGELTQHLYVHYDDRAASHLFTVACGLDSMVVGEPQILGQLRAALSWPRSRHRRAGCSTTWPTALRVGKRADRDRDRPGRPVC